MTLRQRHLVATTLVDVLFRRYYSIVCFCIPGTPIRLLIFRFKDAAGAIETKRVVTY